MEPFNPTILTRRTTADFSSSEYLMVRSNGDDDLALADDPSFTGEPILGALTNDVADGSAGVAKYLPVQIGGIIKIKCRAHSTGAIVAGQPVMCHSDGTAMLATTGNWIIGYALETTVLSQVGTFQYAPCFYEQG